MSLHLILWRFQKNLFQIIDDTIIEMGRDIFYGDLEVLKDALAHKSVEGCGHCDYCLTNKSLTTAKTVAVFLQQ